MNRPSRLLVLGLALVVVLSTAPAVVATGPESDIPGVPLTSAVMIGKLGGPIYDVVYYVDVPPGSVIVAGMSGSAGTDFDLYLFDSSATTVLSETGLVKKSTGPTSLESLSYPSPGGGRYYIDLNGASDVEGTYVLTAQVVPDPTPPVITGVVVDKGAPATNRSVAEVVVLAGDDLSGVSQMATSTDGVNYGPWTPYPGSLSWTLSPGDGLKKIWVKVENGVGLDSAAAVGSIVFDTTQPTVTAVTPARNSPTTASRPTIRVGFSEAMDPVSWRSLGFVLQDTTGMVVPGTLSFDTAANAGVFSPTSDLIPGVLYFATVAQPTDLAGNVVAPTGSWWLKRVLPSSVSLRASASIVTYGKLVTLSGSANVPTGATVVIEGRPAGAAAYADVQTVVPSSGAFSVVVQPAPTTTYRAVYAGSATTAASQSTAVPVSVRWSAVLSGRGPSIVRTGVAGRGIAIQGRVGPAIAGLTVSFKLYRFDPSRRAYIYAGSRGARTRADGTASISWTPSAGRWQWRLSVGSAAGYLGVITPAYTYSISRS